MLVAVIFRASAASLFATAAVDSPTVAPFQASSIVADSPAVAPQVVRAIRLARPPVVDGALSDELWRGAERVTAFLQRDPHEGAQPTESTVVYVVYDDAALYIGARMYDAHPDSIIARLGRRDAVTDSDAFTVFIDPYHDRLSGYYFGVNAAGTLSDGTLYNDEWDDDSWDGVWEGRAARDSLGWMAEFRIPYSQLRFIQRPEYVWGINFRRDIARKNERDYLVYTPKNGSGFVSRFVDLVGIERVMPPPRLEVLPYTTGKAEFSPRAGSDPFNDGSRLTPGIGADARIGLGPNLTLNATVNPDFGQVEVDPAVVNLSDAETFFQEKRPFFIEGSSIFSFGRGGARNYWGFNWSEPRFFYSRRIGRGPQGSVPEADYADVPSGAHILGAVKLTGKARGSWNLGALSAVTARETARLDTAGVRFKKEVEPFAYYGVLRAQKEFPGGRQGLGMMSTVAARAFQDATLRDDVNGTSLALGLDGWTFLDRDKEWVVTGWAGVTRVTGTAARISTLQHDPRHYFQQPDARHVRVDPAATSLSGWAARVYLNKQKGNWFSNSAIGVIAPAFDVHDVGFLWRTGLVNMHVGAGHAWTQPGKVLRYAELGGALFRTYDWDGNINWTGVYHFGNVQLLNYQRFNWDLAYNPWTVNNRRTRGGPLTLNPPGYQVDVGWNSDTRKPWVVNVWTGTYQAESDRNWYLSPDLELRPASNISMSVGPNLFQEDTPVQYVGTFDAAGGATATYGKRYVFGTLHQTELSAGIRLNWTYTPKLSLQLYAQPLISAGRYTEFKELARPRTFDFNHYGRDVGTITRDADGRYHVQASAAPSDTFSFADPNFNLVSLRGNAVLRWEYLPGSTVYFVWTQSRSDEADIGDFQFRRSMDRLLHAKAENILLVKLTYWWNP